MAKKNNKPTPEGAHLVVNTEIMALIKSGKITHNLMTHKDMMGYTGPISVFVPGKEDQAVQMEVTKVMRVGHGYLATGYPDTWRTRGVNNGVCVLYVLPASAQPKTESVPTNAEGDE